MQYISVLLYINKNLCMIMEISRPLSQNYRHMCLRDFFILKKETFSTLKVPANERDDI